MKKLLLLVICFIAHNLHTMKLPTYCPADLQTPQESVLGQRILSNIFNSYNSNNDSLRQYIGQLSKIEQRSLLKTPQIHHCKWLLKGACASYAQQLSNTQTLHYMLQNDMECRKMLNLPPSIQNIICKSLLAHNWQDINHYIPLPQANIQNIIKSRPYNNEQAREAIMQTPFDGNIRVLKKLFDHNIFQNQNLMTPAIPSPIVPSSIFSSHGGKEVFFNEQKIIQNIMHDHTLLHPISAYLISPSGKHIIALYKERTKSCDKIFIFYRNSQGMFTTGLQIELQEEIFNLTSHCPYVHQDIQSTVSIHPHEPIITYVDKTQKIRTANWLTGDQQILPSQYTHKNVSYSPDGRFLATICDPETLAIYNTETFSLEKVLSFSSTPKSICWSPDGSKLAIIIANETFVLNSETMALQHIFKCINDEYNYAAFSHDSTKLIILANTGLAVLWNLGAHIQKSIQLPSTISAASSPIFVDDTHILINSFLNNTLSVYLLDTENNTLAPFKAQDLIGLSQRKYSLPQVILLLSFARILQNNDSIQLSKNHYLAGYIHTLLPHIAAKIKIL